MTYTQPVAITWNDGINPPSAYTLSADALNSLEAFRLTVTTTPGGPPRYDSVVSMVKGYLNQYLVVPALEVNYPPAVQSAYDAYQAALASAISQGQIT